TRQNPPGRRPAGRRPAGNRRGYRSAPVSWPGIRFPHFPLRPHPGYNIRPNRTGPGPTGDFPMSDRASPDWQNPLVLHRNRLPARTTFVAYGDEVSALARGVRPWRVSLNGSWRFEYALSAAEARADYFAESIDDSAWGTLAVPGHWQLNGFGRPHYTNIQYPFPIDPPYVPTENPTG